MSIKPPISGFNREHQADRRDMFPAALLSVAVHGALFVGLFYCVPMEYVRGGRLCGTLGAGRNFRRQRSVRRC